MRYRKSDFITENLHLRQVPKTKQETYNKLACLQELTQTRNTINLHKSSKRYTRLLRMYWAFTKTERMKI